MQINAISNQNFKARNIDAIAEQARDAEYVDGEYVVIKEADKFDDRKFQKAEGLVDKFEKTFIDADDIKGPFETMAAVGFAGIKTFVKGLGSTFSIDVMSGNKLSAGVEQGLKFLSGKAKTFATSLQDANHKEIVKKLGKTLENSENIARNLYKKLSKGSASKGMSIIGGALAVLTFVPSILKRDNNGDGVADIVQKSQNVYDRTSANLSKLQEGVGIVAEMTQLLA